VGQLDYTSPVTIRNALYRWLPNAAWRSLPMTERLARPFTAGSGRLAAVDLASGSRRAVALGGASPEPVALPQGDAWGYLAGSTRNGWNAGARHWHGQWDIALWKDGSPDPAVAVTDDDPLDEDPAFSPDGGTLYFASERSGLPQILSYKMNDGSLVQASNEPTGARQPAPAPDGSLFYATMLWDGWAVVHAVPQALPAARPGPPVAPPADTIAGTPLRVSGYRPWASLKPHFWLPTWHDVGLAGRFVGIATFGVDAIGRTSYFLQLALAPENRRTEASLQVTHRRWKAFGLDASYVVSWDSLLMRRALLQTDSAVDTVQVTFGDVQQTGGAGVTYQWLRWRRSLAVRLGGEVETERLVIDTIDQGPAGLRLSQDRFTFAGPVLSFAAQTLSAPALAISPERGAALNGLFRFRHETAGSGWWSELRGSVEGYLTLPLPGFAHWVLAARTSGGIRDGPSADGYDLGGASGNVIEIVPGYALGAGRRLFPLRGYPAVGTGYTRAAASAVELRVPLALVGKSIWKLPLGLDRLSLSLFGEAGGGWRAVDAPRPFALRDVGGELVLDGAVPQDIGFRLRVGVGVPLTPGLGVGSGESRGYVAFGTAF
jgi:hypothetical protein